MLADIAFDAHLERHLRRRTPYARPEETDLHNSRIGDADELEITPVGLDGGPNEFDHAGDPGFEFAHIHTGQLLISHLLE